jgi:hypothetical protein
LLAERGMRRTKKIELALVILTYCPNLPPVGTRERKNELNKASRYAKLINRAQATGLTVDDFEEYAPRAGVQRTARGASASEPFSMTLGVMTPALAQQMTEILRDSDNIRHIVTLKFHI